MSGTDLGNRLSPVVSKQTIAHWEAGRYRPQVDQVAQLCAALGMSANELVLGTHKTPSPRAMQMAEMYDSLPSGEKERLELMLMAMGMSSEIDGESVNTDREGMYSSDSSNQRFTMRKKAGPKFGPALTMALEAGKGVRDADSQSGGISKPRGNKRS